MISVFRTKDIETIDYVLKHPRVKPHIGDDYTAEMDISYPLTDNYLYLLGMVDDSVAAMFVFVRMNYVLFDGHSAVIPMFYKHSRDLGKKALDWMFSNTECQKIVGQTPITNKLAIKYNRDVGFSEEGINKRSVMKSGRLVDQIYFGLEREKWALS